MHNEEQTPSKDVYTLVTERIITLLEQGCIPWRKPWTASGIPQNLLSKRPYGGINVLLLNAMEFEQNFFLTWNQIQDIGATVAKGERGTFVVFQSKIEQATEKEGERVVEHRMILRYYKVFNIAQCHKIPQKFLPQKVKGKDNQPVATCESVVKAMPLCPKIKHSDRGIACYTPSTDTITLPKLSTFESSSAYYGALFHELIHATGAQKRLARASVCENPRFGSEPYSQEELIAEIGSCYLKSLTGVPVEDLENSTSYIEHWLQVLKNDKRFIVQAASKAQQAVGYILRTKETESAEQEK